ncbi:putative pentatricopeptide repeat-containing protein At3g15930 [Coffea arabica]|uniref:Pentatricopeptide repeat-containing protein At3g15930 n=1 Tax=Coffea arabica TaxID=13443 RepID=A0A6P6XAR5_COFAR
MHHLYSLMHNRAVKKTIYFISVSTAYPIRSLHTAPAAHQNLGYPFQNSKTLDQLKQIHSLAIQKGLALDVSAYSKIISFCCAKDAGDMDYALHVFDTILEPNVFLWNTMIKGYSQTCYPEYAIVLYKKMLERNVKPDNYTFPFLLKGFNRDFPLECGKGTHAHICKFGFDSNEFVQQSLIHVYCLSGQIDMARLVFDTSKKSEAVTWNTMISGYNRMGQFEESRKLFKEMEKRALPTSVTLVLVLSACSELKDLDAAKHVHQCIQDGRIESNLTLNNALIDIYAACGQVNVALGIFISMNNRDVISWTALIKGYINAGQVDKAQRYFDLMPRKDSVSWTAMIDGYLKTNRFKDVLLLFREMQAANVEPDKFTIVSIITACAHLGALELGEWVRTYTDKLNIDCDIHVGNALIDMYFKCGDVEKATRMFHRMPQRDKFSWTAMIVGLATNGRGREALNMFAKMLNVSETPDEITYIGVLSACTHSGLVNEGRSFFISMTTQHGIVPNVVHYGCMVDLLGRAGLLKEAHKFINDMPMKANTIIWGALLAACRVHKDVEMAEMAAKQLLQLEPENGAAYVLLCNVYAACKKWDNLRELRSVIMERGIKKTPGCSLIEMNGGVHEFVAGDTSHPQSQEIYLKLEEMTENLKLAGYLPDTSEVFLDISEKEKEKAVSRHSEKLAIAFGLLSSGPDVVIRIVKSLRMCTDCHHVAKLLSSIYERELTVRDRTRFHHFRQGSCSCKDYW